MVSFFFELWANQIGSLPQKKKKKKRRKTWEALYLVNGIDICVGQYPRNGELFTGTP
jgi:hypothetical protein